MSNSRKLLPYEYQLIDALGIEKEEYLAFVAQQHIYEDPKTGTVLDARNWPTVAIVLTIVGTLFQVAAALLSKPPEAPEARGQATTRDEIFAPRYGFNSVQNLAKYGDPVNLVYANTSVNPEGGVRVSTSLLWSSMQSYGGSQLAQLLFLIGGGAISSIDVSRTAFGQTPFRDLISQNYWLYFRPGNTGILRNADVLPSAYGDLTLDDPLRFGNASDNAFQIRKVGESSKIEGFSHSYSPNSANVFGLYGVVPINVDIILRNDDGDVVGARNLISANVPDKWGESAQNTQLAPLPIGTELSIRIASVAESGDSLAELETEENRRSLASVFDNAGVLKLGSTKFKISRVINENVEAQALFASAVATSAGSGPSISYATAQEEGKDSDARAIPGQVNFSVKALARIEEASYATVSPCNIVDFSIKAKVFRRISGRQSQYGSGEKAGWAVSDNGTKHRSAMFIVKYKETTAANYNYLPGIFVIRRAADNDNYVFLRFDSVRRGEAFAKHWQFKFEPVLDPLSEWAAHPELQYNGQRLFHYLENNGTLKVIALPDANLEFNGYSATGGLGDFPPVNAGPAGSREWDLFSAVSDTQYQFSFDQGPEMAIVNVTEQITEPLSSFPGIYSSLSLFGLTMYSGKTVQDLRSLSVYATMGRECRLLATSGNGWGGDGFQYLSSVKNGNACTAPDIFVDTILDGMDGIGRYASIYSTDLKQLAISKKFCEVNGFFMEGVIAQDAPWRQFWATNAGYSLLELGRIGGQDVLLPAVPYDRSSGSIVSSIAISALFNQGNILEDSYKEEFIDYGDNSQDIIVRVIYRSLDEGGIFAKNDSVSVALSDTVEDYATQQTIDASAFVTRRQQAIAIGKLLALSKRHSRRAIEFKTFPTDSPVFPGAYIYVEVAHNAWDRIYSGIVNANGTLNTPSDIPDGTYVALCYKHGTNTSTERPEGTKYFSSITIASSAGQKQSASLVDYEGYLFVLGNEIRRKRVFRVTEVNMDEEGEVTIRASEHATNANGQSLLGLGMIDSSLWTVQ